MLSRQFIRSTQSRTAARWFTRSSIMRESNQKEKSTEQRNDNVLGTRMYRVSDFDKRVLVWVKRYPSMADVPKNVTTDCILTARSKARIKVCNYMIVTTMIGCIFMVIIGKRQAARGETWMKEREDWYQEMLEKDKKK